MDGAGGGDGMKIALLLVRHPPDRPSPIFPEVAGLLRERGADVTVLYPDDAAIDLGRLAVEHDLYVLKSGTEAALGFAGALHALGAAILNPYPVAAICRDKVVASAVLAGAGVSSPASWVAPDGRSLASLLAGGPLVVKPYRGSQGRGVRVVRDEAGLAGVVESPVFAQRYLEPDGRDRKLYVIGADVFGVERVWPARTYAEKVGAAFEPTREEREIALRCSAAFGMTVFGFDVVMSGGKPYVVDISSFPGFKGVPDAAVRLADHILVAGRRVANGEPLLAGLVGAGW